MPDLFPIYCRACHKKIDSASRVCPYCGEPQGLAAPSQPSMPQPAPPPAPAPTYTPQQPPATGGPGQEDFCPFCQTQVTSGDIFCRACGKGLVPGVRMSDSDAAQAYAISAVVAALLCGSPAAVVLGLIAMAKGARGLGCLAIILFLVVVGVAAVMSAGALHSLLPHALPKNLPGLDLPQ